jgi:NAD(P)-dependent dehydrogenase (short-subunit alcohol dehydrogenase family)
MNQTGRSDVVVITGASAGVGRAAARAFGQMGARVGLLARGEDGLKAARDEVEAAGGRAIICPTDVADPAQVEAAAEKVERELGPIDIWVNNAMTTVFAPFLEITPEEFQRANDVTYMGYVNGTRAALKRMKPRNNGCIVQVGSALAYRSIPLQSPYCGAKHAIKGFTDSLRSELLHDRSDVHLTMVHLPAINTPQFGWCRSRLPNHPQPIPPIFQPELAADAIVWSAYQRRREVWLGRTTVLAILSAKVAPGFGDRYLARNGYESQQMDEPVAPNRQDNLFAPVPGDSGAHGRFDNRASENSPQWWLSKHRSIAALCTAGVAGLIITGWKRRIA